MFHRTFPSKNDSNERRPESQCPFPQAQPVSTLSSTGSVRRSSIIRKCSPAYGGRVQFSSGFRGLDIEERRREERRGRGEKQTGGNFSRVAGNFTLLLGQVSKARLVLVENVVLLAYSLVHARVPLRPPLSCSANAF